jgi:hypothetical protein
VRFLHPLHDFKSWCKVTAIVSTSFNYSPHFGTRVEVSWFMCFPVKTIREWLLINFPCVPIEKSTGLNQKQDSSFVLKVKTRASGEQVSLQRARTIWYTKLVLTYNLSYNEALFDVEAENKSENYLCWENFFLLWLETF